MKNKLLFITLSIFIIAFTRLLPHPLNVTPVAAIALFGGVMFNNRILAFAIPLLAMFVSDLFLGFHNTMWAVYLSFALTVMIGFLVKSENSPIKIAMGSLAGSILFFLLTNFAAWYGNAFYTQDFAGLMTSYAAGVPFFRNSVMGDLFFNAVLFGGYYIGARSMKAVGSGQ